MFKDLLVVLEESDKATPYAIAFALRFDSRLTAIRPRRNLSLMSDGSLEARMDFARGDRQARDAHARKMLEDFTAAAKAAGVDADAVDYGDPDNPEPRDVAEFARAFDLVVIEQGEPGRPLGFGDLAGLLIADSGRPVIVVPGAQREPARFDRILAAWDGSAPAARALSDASPLLERAGHIEIVAVNAAGGASVVSASGERVARKLARLGVDASFHRVPGAGDPGVVLLSRAADVGADLIVSGGYGHSRLREAVLGGVTRTLLANATAPVFMSH
jgi:nucleotide-binding universal stress UspA family protein